MRNRRGCLLIGLAVFAAVAILTAIGLGWFGAVDTAKNSTLPIAGNHM